MAILDFLRNVLRLLPASGCALLNSKWSSISIIWKNRGQCRSFQDYVALQPQIVCANWRSSKPLSGRRNAPQRLLGGRFAQAAH